MTQSTVNERIKILVEHFSNGNKSAFAREVGISNQSLAEILGARQSAPSFPALQKILNSFPQLSSDWLVMGQEPMLRNEVSGNASHTAFLRLADLAGQFLRLGIEFSAKQTHYKQSQHIFETMQRNETESKVRWEEEKASTTPDERYLPILERRAHEAQANRAAYASVYLRDEAAFIEVAKRRAELEKELAELISSAVPLTAEAQIEAIKSRQEITQAFEATVKPR